MLGCCGFLIRNHAVYKLGGLIRIGGKFHVQLRVCLGLGECGGKLLGLDEPLTIRTLLAICLKDNGTEPDANITSSIGFCLLSTAILG